MKKTILTYKNGIYLVNNIDNDHILEKIAYFLRGDVGYDYAMSFKADLYDDKYSIIHGNSQRLDMQGDIVIMSDSYIEDYEERLFYSVEIKRSELVRVLDQWDEICKTMPPYVIITRDGDTITLHGCETLDEN